MALLSGIVAGKSEESPPRIPRIQNIGVVPEGSGDVLANGVALVAVHPSLTLLEVHGIVRQVPMHNCMAVGLEVQAFLAD